MTPAPLDFSVRSLVQNAIHTVRQPRDGAARIMALDLPAALLWELMGLVVVVSVILGQVTMLMAAGGDVPPNPYLANPLVMAGVQLALLVLLVFATHWIGRAMGGQGVFEDALVLVIWLQFVMVCLQVVQTVLFFVAPILAELIAVGGLVLFLWLMTNFVAVLHGFRSLGLVFVMILMSAFALTFAISLLLTLFGFAVGGAPDV